MSFHYYTDLEIGPDEDDSEELAVIRECPDEIISPPSADPYYEVDSDGQTPGL